MTRYTHHARSFASACWRVADRNELILDPLYYENIEGGHGATDSKWLKFKRLSTVLGESSPMRKRKIWKLIQRSINIMNIPKINL